MRVAYSNSPAERRAATPPQEMLYARLSEREQWMIVEVKKLQNAGWNSARIAAHISAQLNNCTLQGVVQQYISGVSQCELWDQRDRKNNNGRSY